MSEFKNYRRSQIAHLRPYVEGEELSDRVSISAADLEAGSPKVGDMIARNRPTMLTSGLLLPPTLRRTLKRSTSPVPRSLLKKRL